MKLKVIDLCSGIGGFSYGLEKTGYFKTIQFVEINPFCQKVLKKNFPGTPIHDDIKTYKPVEADVVTSGFPCQPFSIAGKQDGKNDNRNLWGETLRVIKQSKPTFFIGGLIPLNLLELMCFKLLVFILNYFLLFLHFHTLYFHASLKIIENI